MSTQIAENYQLKWHSHLTNLNTTVSTLYRNDKFADVLLFTSNSNDTIGCGIPAHKIILSSCSHYFASIFDANPPPNGMAYVFLPPELSKRSMQILIQYMYSGEATVSNDILNEVLRGGEVLRIRGLWRNNQTTEPNASHTPQISPPQKTDQSQMSPVQSTTKEPPFEKSVFDHRPTERHPSTDPIKESPVIVMSPQHGQSASVRRHGQSNSTVLQNMLVKKEMANEKSENSAIPPSHYGLVSLQIAAAVKKAQEQQHSDKRKENGLNEQLTSTQQTLQRRFSEETKHIEHDRTRECITSGPLRPTDRRRMSLNVSGNEATRSDGFGKKSKAAIKYADKKLQSEAIPEALCFLTIKQEPDEWNEYDQENGPVDKSSHIEVTVKPEILYNDEDEESDSEVHGDLVYSPLTCELCSETFTIPAEWVRHIEGHSETSQCIPKKRKRLDESSPENIAALRCDLCSMYFVTPAEWVRHVQSTHTETELALSNNSTPPKRAHRPQRSIDAPLEKSCSICNKSFPSYASMIIHKRTHTGERPFNCNLCNKGFNVKSNLLRHMRTLHNQLLNASSVDCPINPE